MPQRNIHSMVPAKAAPPSRSGDGLHCMLADERQHIFAKCSFRTARGVQFASPGPTPRLYQLSAVDRVHAKKLQPAAASSLSYTAPTMPRSSNSKKASLRRRKHDGGHAAVAKHQHLHLAAQAWCEYHLWYSLFMHACLPPAATLRGYCQVLSPPQCSSLSPTLTDTFPEL